MPHLTKKYNDMRTPFNLEFWKSHPDCKVETRDGRAARIICTDKEFSYPIIALAYDDLQREEVCINASIEGKGQCSHYDDLFFVFGEPELTEFQQHLKAILDTCIAEGSVDTTRMALVESKKLLAIARKDLYEFDFRSDL